MNDRETIKSTAQYFLPGCKVILFGSRARGDNSEQSDYDVLVIPEKEIDLKERMRWSGEINSALVKKDLDCDIIIQNFSAYEINKNILGHIVRTAIKEGIEL